VRALHRRRSELRALLVNGARRGEPVTPAGDVADR
jgi:hypothetical protein